MSDLSVVSAQKHNDLRIRFQTLGIRDEDIEEIFIRSSGPGGQNVNKVATCVCLKHRPTGVQVKCQQARSQGLNRFLARRLLANKIEVLQKGFVAQERDRVEKIRRQKRKRSKRAKEKMLESKRLHAFKKESRKKIVRDGE